MCAVVCGRSVLGWGWGERSRPLVPPVRRGVAGGPLVGSPSFLLGGVFSVGRLVPFYFLLLSSLSEVGLVALALSLSHYR